MLKENKIFTKEEIKQYLEDDAKYFIHPDTDPNEMEEKGARLFVKGEGNYIYTIDGRQILDATAGLALVNVGHAREEIAEAAKEQIMTLEFQQQFFGLGSLPVIELAKKVSEKVPVDNAHVFFTCGGSESNDTMYKLMRYYWYSKGQDSKDIIISREKAYHGLNYGAMSATALDMNTGFGPEAPAFEHIPTAHCYYCPFGKEERSCSLECAQALEDRIVELGADNVAGFVAEPIHGAGGYMTPPEGYYEKIAEICKKHDVLFAVDEVITGFGRTGKEFGIQHWDAQPDVLAFAKGVSSGYSQVGGVAISDEMYQSIKTKGMLLHGYTYSGHPVGCKIALKNLEIIERENLVENARIMGDRLKSGLEALDVEGMGKVRGKGLMIGMEMVKDKESREKFKGDMSQLVVDMAFEEGIGLRNTPGDILEVSPPFTITAEEIDRIVATIGKLVPRAHAILAKQEK